MKNSSFHSSNVQELLKDARSDAFLYAVVLFSVLRVSFRPFVIGSFKS